MIYRFANTVVDTDTVTIQIDGVPQACEPKAFALLQMLIENGSRMVTKEEVIERLWDGRFITDSALTSCLNAARRAVGDDGRQQRVIRTIPKRGFRFVAELEELVSRLESDHQSGQTQPAIAVMPFRNLSGEPDRELLVDGVLEDLVTLLSRIRWLTVIASGTMITYRGQYPEHAEVLGDLSVRYLLSGSVRGQGERLRVSVQLFDGIQGRAIWADMFDRTLGEFFEVQDEIVSRVAVTVEQELAMAEQSRAARIPPENLDAWQAYQTAISIMKSGNAAREIDRIANLLDTAIQRDPKFALPHAGRAFTEYWRHVEGLGHSDLALAYHQAEMAIALDPLEPFAHMALAAVQLADGRPARALEALEQAIELNPSFAWGYFHIGIVRLVLEDIAGAKVAIEHAIRLSPRDTLIGNFYAIHALCHFVERDYKAAVSWARRAINYPQPRWAHAYLLSSLGHLRDMAEAKEILTVISRVRPEFSRAYIETHFPLLSGEPRERFLSGLRQAGLRAT